MIKSDPGFALKLFSSFSERLRQSDEVIESLLHREVSTRLATLLINLGERFGESNGAGTLIDVRLTHQDLANMIASTGEAVSKVMSELQRDGIIESRNRRIVIVNGGALAEHASRLSGLSIDGQAATDRALRRPQASPSLLMTSAFSVCFCCPPKCLRRERQRMPLQIALGSSSFLARALPTSGNFPRPRAYTRLSMEYTSTVTIGGWRERLGSLWVRREELDDKELVARTLSGDLRSFKELVSRYERLVWQVAYPYARREISVEDLVQETFLRALDRLETFNPDYRFKTWLLAIANNLGVDTLRRRREIGEFNPEAHAPVSESPESDAVDADRARTSRRRSRPCPRRTACR